MKFLVINGPNINMLGIREPAIYGHDTYSDLLNIINHWADANNHEVEVCQSNYEGKLVDKIQSAYGMFSGIVINPAAYTHTSIAILDALKAVNIPTVEVHISEPLMREPYRHISYVRAFAFLTISGKGIGGYVSALEALEVHAASPL